MARETVIGATPARLAISVMVGCFFTCGIVTTHITGEYARSQGAALEELQPTGTIDGRHVFHVFQSLFTGWLRFLIFEDALGQMIGFWRKMRWIFGGVRFVDGRLTLNTRGQVLPLITER